MRPPRRNLRHLLQNTPFGIFIGCFGTLLLAAGFDTGVQENLIKFYAYIFSGLVTLLASAFALVGVFLSIDQQSNLREEERERKLDAIRISLPGALQQIGEIAQCGIRVSHSFEDQQSKLGTEQFRTVSAEQLSLPSAAIETLTKILELSDDPKVRHRIAMILQEHQILYARWLGEFSLSEATKSTEKPAINKRTTYWAYLYVLTGTMFDYARGITRSVDQDLDSNDIMAALTLNLPKETPFQDFAAWTKWCEKERFNKRLK